jgi:hypothetical protein
MRYRTAESSASQHTPRNGLRVLLHKRKRKCAELW